MNTPPENPEQPDQTQYTDMNTNTEHPYNIGKSYHIRTVTHFYTGILRDVYSHELVLAEAAWIADTGMFSQAMATSDFVEVEPYPKDRLVIIGRGAAVDAVEIDRHPTEQKGGVVAVGIEEQ